MKLITVKYSVFSCYFQYGPNIIIRILFSDRTELFKSRSSGFWHSVAVDKNVSETLLCPTSGWRWRHYDSGNDCILPQHYTASQPRRLRLESSPPWNLKSRTLKLYSSLRVRDWVSYPCKTTAKIIFIHI